MAGKRHLDTPATGIFGNKTVDEVTSYLPILGTIQDGYKLVREPSLANLGWFGLSLASDITGASLLKGLKASRRMLKAAKRAEQIRKTNYYGHLLESAVKPVTSKTTKDILETRRLKQLLDNAAFERARLQGIDNINKVLQYPVYGMWTANDAGVNYMQNRVQRSGIRPIYRNGGTIHINPANRGKFNALKARTGKTTEELTHSSNPLTRKRAIFAQNARKWNKK